MKTPSELFIKQRTSYDIIQYIKKEIEDSIEKQEKINQRAIGTESYNWLMTSEKLRVSILLKLSNSLYGRRVTTKYICKKLEIMNNDL